MKLSKLLGGMDYTIVKGTVDIDINSIQYNSKKVQKEDVFLCIRGFSADGHDYAVSAMERGAAAVICEKDITTELPVTIIKVKDTRKAMAIMAANYYDNPADKLKLIGITGTNGKTTSTYMMKAVLEEAGHKVGLIGTISNYVGNERLHAERTTPESLELQQLFHYMVEKGMEYCVMEVSSHSLELDRVYGVKFKYGIFTNLTQDHLDFHVTFENYYNAKLKLFKSSEYSIVNADDAYGQRIKEEAGCKNITYGIDEAADFKAENIEMHSRGVSYTLNGKGNKCDIGIYIPGRYNIYNSLCAAAVCLSEGISEELVIKGLERVQVPGRCELVTKDYNMGFDIIIDYAHSPDGLENILTTAREFTKNRLIAVFGCGGNRDRTKRPIMGEIGSRLSNVAVITSDNPRDEEPEAIINDILAGIAGNNYRVIVNRKQAIFEAIQMAEAGDVIVIAGKGHEDYQIFKNNEIIHFDEREIVKEILDDMLR